MPPETESEVRASTPRNWSPPAPHLFVVLEGERPLASGLRCALLDVEEVRIGRGEVQAVRHDRGAKRVTLAIADRKISQDHARLVRVNGAWQIEDAGSTNGSFVNARPITREVLADGDVIQVGRTLLRLRGALVTPRGAREVVTGAESQQQGLGLGTLVPAMAGELEVVARIARSAVPVLLLGETGSGKEVMARAVHEASRRPGSFVAVNCGALPEALVESQLFGHVKGAFSGAARDEPGLVRGADQGTLFLDEIGDLPPAAQAVLLRVLQEGEVVPVGASRPVRVDVRVVAATHRPIEAMIERGEFRADLFARLQGFTHRLWPLRDRVEDLGLLVGDLLRRAGRREGDGLAISVEAARALVGHPWPLNVRELAQCLARALAIVGEGPIELDHLGPAFLASSAPEPGVADPDAAADAALRDALVGHLRRHRGNVTAVARAMNKAPMQVYRWMRRLGLDPKTYR